MALPDEVQVVSPFYLGKAIRKLHYGFSVSTGAPVVVGRNAVVPVEASFSAMLPMASNVPSMVSWPANP